MSDLHWEFDRDYGVAFAESVESQAPLLILAGDVLIARRFGCFMAALRILCAKFDRVIYIPGNHEAYGSAASLAWDMLAKDLAAINNLTFTHRGVIEYGGQRYVCCTLWFPFLEGNENFESGLSDFSVIRSFKPWVYRESERDTTFLSANMQPGDIVVTHHLPSHDCVSPRWRGDPLDRFFVHDVERLISSCKPRAWIHGHTHDSRAIRIDGVPVVCNPRGYTPDGLNREFNSSATISISEKA